MGWTTSPEQVDNFEWNSWTTSPEYAVRTHRALKFGREVRTPAMQAGLVSKRLSLREIFLAEPRKILFVVVFLDLALDAGSVREQRLAA